MLDIDSAVYVSVKVAFADKLYSLRRTFTNEMEINRSSGPAVRIPHERLGEFQEAFTAYMLACAYTTEAKNAALRVLEKAEGA